MLKKHFAIILILSFFSFDIYSSMVSVFGDRGTSTQGSSTSDNSGSDSSSVFGSSRSRSSEDNSSGSSLFGRSGSSRSNSDNEEVDGTSKASSVFGSKTRTRHSSSLEPEAENNNTGSRASGVFGSRSKRRQQKVVARTQTGSESNKTEEKETSETPTVTESSVAMPENPRKAPEFLWPVDGGKISSFYGWRSSTRFHDGIDIMGPSGTKIFASKSGQVIYSNNKIRGYGNMIVIRHNQGIHTVYSHNKVNKVRKGDIVSQGDVIALLGNTGHSSGPHLHFEVRKGKYSKDPLKYLGAIPSNKGAYKNNNGEAIFSK